MFDLPYWKYNGSAASDDFKSRNVEIKSATDGKDIGCAIPKIYSISACNDAESSMDDISSTYGFDGKYFERIFLNDSQYNTGGLVAAFLDANNGNGSAAILKLYECIFKRLALQGQTSVICTNQSDTLL